jgi:hypothetical protein
MLFVHTFFFFFFVFFTNMLIFSVGFMYIFLGCVIPTSHYLTSILHQDTLGIRPIYIRPTCMGPTPYVSWCKIDVG